MSDDKNIGNILDGEIHYLTSLYNPLIKFKIRFIWCLTGYKICIADNKDFVLTLDTSTATVSMKNIYDLKNQIWTVCPYRKNHGFALINNDLILCIKNGSFKVSHRHCRYSHLTLRPVSGWIRFGAIMLQYLGIINVTDTDVTRTVNNFSRNIEINFSDENRLRYNGTTLVVFQSGGSFPQLRYAQSDMNNTSCEIMAVCNAIRLLTGKCPYKSTDFFKLTAEFEISGLEHSKVKKAIVTGGKRIGIKLLERVPTEDGCWGGDPLKIRNCLTAYNIKFLEFHDLNRLDDRLSDGKCAVVSYRFDLLHQAIHTYSGIKTNDRFQAFNRFSNHSCENNYLNKTVPLCKREIYTDVKESVFINNHNQKFYVGYILESMTQ